MIIGINGYATSGKDTVGKIIQDLTSPRLADYCQFRDGKWEHVKGSSTWQIKKYAYKMKLIASILTGIPVEKFDDQEFKKTTLGPEWDTYPVKYYNSDEGRFETYFAVSEDEAMEFVKDVMDDYELWLKLNTIERKSMTVREFLQKLGTEAIRDGLHPRAWGNALYADYKPQHTLTESILNRGIREGDEEWEKGRYLNWIITDLRYKNEAAYLVEKGGITVRVNREGVGPVNDHQSEWDLDTYQFDSVIENNGTIDDLVRKVKQFLLEFKILK